MDLLESVTRACTRLAPGGWHSLLLRHGLDILAAPLATELIKPLTIDRSLPGFEDFSSAGNRAIESGQPSRSLLYHALASPEVTLDGAGQPLLWYPTPAEIEAVLDYVYGVNPPTLEDLQRKAEGAPLALVVFASEYRCAGDTVHGEHADLCFSRTGIARVGTAAARYDPQLRCFLPFVDDDVHGIRVMPVRYSAYIAMQHKGDATRFGPMDFRADVDADLDFWVPLHKLFDGTQCLAGLDLTLELDKYQINEKLRHIHLRHSGTGWGEPEISQPPFVITDGLADWAAHADFGLGLLLPQPKSRLVELAYHQGNPLSFQMPAGTAGMVHGRHKVLEDGSIEDLNDREGVAELVRQGGYPARHYLDGTADGWVQARCPALENVLPTVAAYSVIGAPDFFPLCSQRQLKRWANTEPALPSPDIWHARLEALSNVRYCANLSLKDQPFSPDDRGVTAIVALPREVGSTLSPSLQRPPVMRPSSLPDAAAGIFGPGWEVGWVRQQSEDGTWLDCLSGYQMASPFTEDVRICAALGSYWPGVAPDSARTFEPRGSLHTIIPLTDQEIGQTDDPAWDNQRGPRLVQEQQTKDVFVQYDAYEYTDYTRVALDGHFSLQLTGNTTLLDYEDRVLSMHRVYNALGIGNDKPLRNTWPLLSFTLVQRPNPELDTAQQETGLQLNGWVHRYQLYERGSDPTPDINFKLRNVKILHLATLLVSAEAILVKHDESPWQDASESL
ncbi:hypothetical protein ABIA48_000628 [Pseudomonas sp. S30_BP2TU TE3576]|uniref:hypothetical protein n=1 Tax=Pseudomonas sp. S30_BP2TU TE3576 TaxID=3349329 RepID=UPI003D1C9DE2